MAAHPQSLAITDTYRRHLVSLAAIATRAARTQWEIIDPANLDRGHAEWVARTAPALAALQAAGVRLTAAYITAFLRSELRHPVAPPTLDEARYVALSRTGKPLAAALTGTLITAKVAIADGTDPRTALDHAASQARRVAGTETTAAARAALGDTIATDPRIVGWQRATGGGCGACLAAATRTYGPDEPLQVHDNCRCTAEPIVADVPDTTPRPDGFALFDRMSAEQQDRALGPAADLVRSGRVALTDLLAVSPMAAIADQITQAPLEALT